MDMMLLSVGVLRKILAHFILTGFHGPHIHEVISLQITNRENSSAYYYHIIKYERQNNSKYKGVTKLL